jgi:hypothetical protein
MTAVSKIKRWFAAITFVAVLGGGLVTVAVPQSASAACQERVLTFPAWYRGILESNCTIKNPASFDTGAGKGDGLAIFITKIGLNVIEFMLQLVGYLSVAFIIVGGYKYLIGAGASDDIAKAKKTILNAIIGLIISIFSVAIVNVVAGVF